MRFRNIRFYDVKAVQRKRKRTIQTIKDSLGNWIEEPEDIKRLFNGNYHKMYTANIEVATWIQTINAFPRLEDNITP